MTNEYSLSDIAAATGSERNNGFMGDGAWWIIILFLFAFMGGGFRGGLTGNGGGVQDGYVLASDMARVQQTISSGLCDGFYSTAQLINGVNMQNATNTASIQQTLTQGFSGLNGEMVRQGYETRIGINGIGQQLQQCCCDTKMGIADLKYTIAQGDCQTGAAISNAARDIIDSQNANYRALHDEIVANRMEDKNAQIQAQQQQIFALQLAASQAAQNNYLVDKLGTKCPIPAYLTCNPNAPLNYSVNYGGCGCAG